MINYDVNNIHGFIRETLINFLLLLCLVMERIALDPKTLKALAGETRIRIMKLLDSRQLTQSDLANELKMSLPTVGEHLKALEQAELVEREQTERKWKYYYLTNKARLLLHPQTTTIWFVLGLFLFSLAGMMFNAVRYFTPVAGIQAEAKMALAQESVADAMMASAPAVAGQAAQSPVWLIAFGAAALVFLIMLIRLLYSHGWLGKSLTNKKNI